MSVAGAERWPLRKTVARHTVIATACGGPTPCPGINVLRNDPLSRWRSPRWWARFPAGECAQRNLQ